MSTTQQKNAPALEAAQAACRRIAPLWPLERFVAVNPFHGLTGKGFAEAAAIMAGAAGAHATMPRSFYLEALESGRIAQEDLTEALAEAGHGDCGTTAFLKSLESEAAEPTPLPSLADSADRSGGQDWAAFAVEQLSLFAAERFDQGQLAWSRDSQLGLYEDWRALAKIDRTPDALGLKGYRAAVSDLPETPEALLTLSAQRLGLEGEALLAYFHRLLMTVGGWAGYVRHLEWEAELKGGEDDSLLQLLAIRAAMDLALLDADQEPDALLNAWKAEWDEARSLDRAALQAPDLVLQSAYEKAWHRELAATLETPVSREKQARPDLQAAFCIDVRSEVYRRALESLSPGIETIGFAGFFGLALDYRPIGQDDGGARCPVLLPPALVIEEEVKGAGPAELDALRRDRTLRRRLMGAWKSFKLAAVSSFAFVETAGLGYAVKLVSDSLGTSRPVPHPAKAGLDSTAEARLRPSLAGIPVADRPAIAEAVLRGMSLTQDFAPLVLLAGHGSTSVNNPHAKGLDCGACGGQSGEVNAQLTAALLNDPDVRAGLAEKGIAIPEDTIFIGALHDTTLDEVKLYDAGSAEALHPQALATARQWLSEAGALARAERAPLLGLGSESERDARIAQRARDWSQVRPEWGLAGCAAFIAAPRETTQGRGLGGRAFLHSYDWRKDEGFATLELIMTAPMVVASWIGWQYYGSTVDNRVYGSGDKTLHNIVGALGVFEGNGGDLRVGLPWQSLHDGERLIHEPLRLTVAIQAPTEAINGIIEKHGAIADLLDKGWLHLFALDDDGRLASRYRGGLAWEALGPSGEAMAA